MSRPTNKRRGCSRRAFLAGLGAAAAAPLVPILEAEADGAAPPQRLILLCSANGTIHDQWKPGFDGTTLTLGPVLAPLESHKQDLLVLDGLGWHYEDGPGVDHMRICMLWNGTPMLDGTDFYNSTNDKPCSWGGGISVDQFIAGELPQETLFRSLEFGVQNGDKHIYSRVSYAGPNQPIPPEDDPYAMFDRLFSDFGKSAAELERLRARRKSVIDVVKDQLGAVHGKIGMADRLKIEAHLDAVRQIEKRLDATASCDIPVLGAPFDPNANDNFPLVSRLQIDMMMMALRCDLTRIASLLWARAGSQVRYTWLGIGTEQHTLAHDGGDTARNQIAEMNAWHAGEVAYLLDALKSDAMLDSTLVVWGNELADGWTHAQEPIPFVLAGGGLATGRYLDFGDARHNRLLVSLCNLMGLSTVTSFGALDDGSGALDGLV